MTGYRGRFAPSPTGALHAGSLVAALASWLDARAHQGQWLVRIEDVDRPRCSPELARIILQQLDACGLQSDQPPLWQSSRSELYQQALDQLVARQLAYPCACTRRELEAAHSDTATPRPRNAELVYPGTCRNGLKGSASSNKPLAWRARSNSGDPIRWSDRRLGAQEQDVEREVGDFVLQRADGCYSYQLAVVVDDAAQGITDVVRGEDLSNNTARQILLQRQLALPTPRYLHTPLVLGVNQEKLSKQNGALSIDSTQPLAALNQAALVLGLPPREGSLSQALSAWVGDWNTRLKSVI
ncbi:MAG: tRNA glutamyl-Q(34) synthetase GluQRS [Comamonadaceae bacterium]|nr:MAG: tRNA glutamyl-Q(34) synthetase GluQRS [Comamonadaceae bacterium]